MKRTAAERRHHRERVIHNRISYIRNVLHDVPWGPIGRFARHHPADCNVPDCIVCAHPPRDLKLRRPSTHTLVNAITEEWFVDGSSA